MNAWYDRYAGTSTPPQQSNAPQQQNGYSGIQFQNPMQKMNYIRQAMVNPAAFVGQAIPNLPAEIRNDPNRILAYMKQNLGVTDADIQYAASQIPRGW